MADINTLLGMNLGPNADMQALAQQLRGQQDEGRFLGMSTLAPVAQYGQNLQQGAVNAATQGGALRQSMAKERQAQENYNATALAKTNAAEQANQNNKSAAKKLLTERTGQRDTKSYWHPTKQGVVLNLREGPDGQNYDQQGQAYDTELLTPYRAPSVAGSSQKLSKKEEEADILKEKRLQGKDFVSKSMMSPFMAGAMGSKADLGKLGPSLLGINEQTGSLQTDLNSMTVTQAAEPLSYLGVNPTDKDLQFALDAVRTLDSQPESWRNWYAGVYNDDIKRAIMDSKDLTRAEKLDALDEWEVQLSEVLAEMDANIELESGKSAGQRLKETGNEKEVIKYKKRSKAPSGVSQEEWSNLSDEDKDFYLDKMVK